jgi:hypothetical protein
VKAYLDSVEQLSGWSVDTTTGLVTFGTAPAVGVEVAVFRCNGVRRFERGALRRFERRAFGASKIEG